MTWLRLATYAIAVVVISAIFVTVTAADADIVYEATISTPTAESKAEPTAVATRRSEFDEGEIVELFSSFVFEPAPPLPPSDLSETDGWESWLRKAEVPESAWPAVTVVSQCESGRDPSKVGDGGSSIGILQIQPFAGGQHLWRLGELGYPLDPDLLFDPVINLRVGMHITSNGVDWRAFSCQPDGTIKKW